jgi:Zn-dependent protease
MGAIRLPRIRVRKIWFLLLLGLVVLNAVQQGSALAGLVFAAHVAVIFAVITLHELGHCFAAAREGFQARQIHLTPLGGIAEIPPPDSPLSEIIISLAGPLVNLVLLVCAFVLALLVLPQSAWGGFSLISADGGLLMWFFRVNAVLLLFNLLPAFPLDGGRVLRALLSIRMDYVRATSIAATIGAMAAGAMGLYGLMNGLWLLVGIAVYVFVQGQAEKRMAPAIARMHAERASSSPWAASVWEGGQPGGFDTGVAYEDPMLADADAGREPRREGKLQQALNRWRERSEAARRAEEAKVKHRVEELLGKISREGMEGLTRGEKKFLEKASRYYGRKNGE